MESHLVRSNFPDVYIPEHQSVTDFLFPIFTQYADKTAMIDGVTGSKISFSYIVDVSRHVAGALYRRGVRQGDVLLIVSPNSLQFPIIVYATLAVGAVISTANPLYTAGEICAQMEDSGAKFVYTVPEQAEKVHAACKKYGNIQHILVDGEAAGCESFSSLLEEQGAPAPKPNIRPQEDIAVLPYSSGTTGKPKGVMLTHYNLIANICQVSAPGLSVLKDTDVSLAVVPFFHIYGLVVVQMAGLSTGTTIVSLNKMDLKIFLQCIQNYKVTTLFLVPPLAIVLAKNAMVEDYDMSSVKNVLCGAAPLGSDIARELRVRFPGFTEQLRQGFGMTETTGVVTITPSSIPDPGSAGMVVPNVVVKVVDIETGASCGAYVEGEICAKGPNMMKGYLKNAEATLRTIDRHGWLHTGDIGYYNKDGQFYIIDRLKELIKYNGFQVAPASLESLLLTHPAISDSAVIGIPDLMAGELPRAYVVLKPGQTATEEQVKTFVSAEVAPHMRLRGGVHFIKEIPKSASGKILRRELKQQAAAVKAKL